MSDLIPVLNYNDIFHMSKEQIYRCFDELQTFSIKKIEELEKEIQELKEKLKQKRHNN